MARRNRRTPAIGPWVGFGLLVPGVVISCTKLREGDDLSVVVDGGKSDVDRVVDAGVSDGANLSTESSFDAAVDSDVSSSPLSEGGGDAPADASEDGRGGDATDVSDGGNLSTESSVDAAAFPDVSADPLSEGGGDAPADASEDGWGDDASDAPVEVARDGGGAGDVLYVPAVSSPAERYLNVYAARPPSGLLARRRWLATNWETDWTVFRPGSTLSVLPNAQPAAVFFGASGSKKEAVCIRARDVMPVTQNQTWCSVEDYQNGEWVALGPEDSVAGPALAARSNSHGSQDLYLFGIDSGGALTYRSYSMASASWSSAALVTGAPTDLTSVAAVGVGIVLHLCGRRVDQYWCTAIEDLDVGATWTVVPGTWSTPAALAATDAAVVLAGVVEGGDQLGVMLRYFGTTTWTPREFEGAGLASAPSIVSWGADTIHVYAKVNFEENVWTTNYYQGSWAGMWSRL